MKKKITAIIVLALIMVFMSLPVFAAEDDSEAQLSYVTDSANILTDAEELSLQQEATVVSIGHGCSVYIVTVDDFKDYSNDVIVCAEQIFDEYNLGFGEDRNGVLLLLSMDDRDYSLIAHGSTGNAAFTDYGKEVLADEFLDDFHDNDWYEGFEDYIEACGEFLTAYEQGAPVDTNPEDYDGRYDERYEQSSEGSGSTAVKLILTIAVPILAALVFVIIGLNKMKSVHNAVGAERYVDENTLKLTESWDRFSHTTEVIIPKPDPDKNGGGLGGGGTTIGGGGFSGSSGKF